MYHIIEGSKKEGGDPPSTPCNPVQLNGIWCTDGQENEFQ